MHHYLLHVLVCYSLFSNNNEYRWFPLGKLSHLGLEQLLYHNSAICSMMNKLLSLSIVIFDLFSLMAQLFSYMYFQVWATHVLLVQCFNILYKIYICVDPLSISILCLSIIALGCLPVFVSSSPWSSRILICFVPWVWYNEFPRITIYSTGPLSTSMGKLYSNTEVCSVTLSADDYVCLYYFSERVVALKLLSRGFWWCFCRSPWHHPSVCGLILLCLPIPQLYFSNFPFMLSFRRWGPPTLPES